VSRVTAVAANAASVVLVDTSIASGNPNRLEETGDFFWRICWLWYQLSHPVAAGDHRDVRSIQSGYNGACGSSEPEEDDILEQRKKETDERRRFSLLLLCSVQCPPRPVCFFFFCERASPSIAASCFVVTSMGLSASPNVAQPTTSKPEYYACVTLADTHFKENLANTDPKASQHRQGPSIK
jgi:hypothetical protein